MRSNSKEPKEKRKERKKILVVSITVISCRAQYEIQRTLTLSSKLICGNHPTDNTEFLQANELISTIQ